MAGQVKSCERCGKHFPKPDRLSPARWGVRRFCSKSCSAMKMRVPHSEIVAIYGHGSSSTEIAELFGISGTHVLRVLKQNGVVIRSASEGKKLSHARPSTLAKLAAAATGRRHSEASKDKLRARVGSLNAQWRNGLTVSSQGYLVFTASEANGEHAGKALHAVIAEWKLGRPMAAGDVVHHIDRNKLNNDPKNLEVLTASDHAILHFKAGEFVRKHNA